MRRSRVASGSERLKIPSRTPARSCACASAMSPPITITAGLKKFTVPARTSPSVRPAARTIWVAVTLPSCTSRTTSRLFGCLDSGGREPHREGVTSGHRLEAADVAARADHVLARGADVTDVPGGSARTSVDVPVGHDPAADARADLHEEEVGGMAPVNPVLAAGHDVHVVVHEHRGAVVLREPRRDVEAVPPGHDRGIDRPPGVELHRARHADADPADVGSALPGRLKQLVEAGRHPRQHLAGPSAMSRSPARSASGVPARSVGPRARGWRPGRPRAPRRPGG